MRLYFNIVRTIAATVMLLVFIPYIFVMFFAFIESLSFKSLLLFFVLIFLTWFVFYAGFYYPYTEKKIKKQKMIAFTKGFFALASKVEKLNIHELPFLDPKENNYKLSFGEGLLGFQNGVELKKIVETGEYTHTSTTRSLNHQLPISQNLSYNTSFNNTRGKIEWKKVEAKVASGRLILTTSTLNFEGDTQNFIIGLSSIANVDLTYNILILRPKHGEPIKFEINDFNPDFAVMLIKILE